MFNTYNSISNSPIYVINDEQYPGGTRDNSNPIILAYNGTHFESLDTCSEEDNIKAIDLVESVKIGEYKLVQKDIQGSQGPTKTLKHTTHINTHVKGVLTNSQP